MLNFIKNLFATSPEIGRKEFALSLLAWGGFFVAITVIAILFMYFAPTLFTNNTEIIYSGVGNHYFEPDSAKEYKFSYNVIISLKTLLKFLTPISCFSILLLARRRLLDLEKPLWLMVPIILYITFIVFVSIFWVQVAYFIQNLIPQVIFLNDNLDAESENIKLLILEVLILLLQGLYYYTLIFFLYLLVWPGKLAKTSKQLKETNQ